jgi:hypothetical protein
MSRLLEKALRNEWFAIDHDLIILDLMRPGKLTALAKACEKPTLLRDRQG